MRIWSLHPSYLDAKGLVALWRESLLAQNVLLGKTKGYKNHPQLDRFKATDDPVAAIAQYLTVVAEEAAKRRYNFNVAKIQPTTFKGTINVTQGQVDYEFQHLLNKLKTRAPDLYLNYKDCDSIMLHPLFTLVEGDIEPWEIV